MKNSNTKKRYACLPKGMALLIIAIVFIANAHAQIVYTDVNPDQTVTCTVSPCFNTYNLDLNGDGIIDFTIHSSYTKTNPKSSDAYISIKALDSNSIAFASNGYISALAVNMKIGSFSIWGPSSFGYLKRHKTTFSPPATFNYGNWTVSSDKYLGLKIIKNGHVFYGWAHLSVTGNSTFTIKEYAYDITPGHKILTGATTGARYEGKVNRIVSSHHRNNLPFQSPNTNESFTVINSNKRHRPYSPNIQWQSTVGGSGDESSDGERIIKLADGNYLHFGTTNSTDGDFSGLPNKGGYDAWLMKINPAGNILWKKSYGGSWDDYIYSVIQNPNGSFTAVGFTNSNDGDVSGNHGDYDVWFLRLTSNGTLSSSQCYGGTGDDDAFNFVKGTGNSFVLAAYSNSNDGDVSGNHGDYDGWVFEVGNNGSIIWSQLIGGSDYDDMYAIAKTKNGKLIVSGTTSSNDGDASGNHGGDDALIVKLNQNGNKIWSVCHGGSGNESMNAVASAQDGNIAFSLNSSSNDGDANGNNNPANSNTWTFKMNVTSGNIIWQTFSGTATDINAGFNITSANDGGFLVTGATAPNNWMTTAEWDAQAIKISSNGNTEWIKNFGGSAFDEAIGAIATSNGGYLIACNTKSNDGDVTNYHGDTGGGDFGGDAWLVQLNGNGCHPIRSDGMELSIDNSGLTVFPSPVSSVSTVSFSLGEPQVVNAKIYDMSGKLISTLCENKSYEKGVFQFEWNASFVETGIYFLKLEAGNYSESRKLSVLK